MITGIGHFFEGYMFFIGDTPMNCVDGWRMFWDRGLADGYLKPEDVDRANNDGLSKVTLRRVRVAVEVVE